MAQTLEGALRVLLLQTAEKLDSSDPADVIEALNMLTRKSQEYDSSGIVLEAHAELTTALSCLLDVIHPLGCFYFMGDVDDGNSSNSSSSGSSSDSTGAATSEDPDSTMLSLRLPSEEDGDFKVSLLSKFRWYIQTKLEYPLRMICCW